MGPGQPLFGLDASTRRFEEPFGLHEGKKTMVAGDVRVGTRQSFFDWRIHDKLVSSGSSGVVVLRGDWTTRGGLGVAERRLVLHSFRRKPPVYKQTLCQKEGKLSVPLGSHFSFSSRFGARRQSVRSVGFWSSASKFEGRSKRFERHVVVRSGHQALFSLVHPVELSLARTLPSPHRPPPPPPISSFSSAVPRCTGRPRPHSSALASRSFRGLGFPSRAVASYWSPPRGGGKEQDFPTPIPSRLRRLPSLRTSYTRFCTR